MPFKNSPVEPSSPTILLKTPSAEGSAESLPRTTEEVSASAGACSKEGQAGATLEGTLDTRAAEKAGVGRGVRRLRAAGAEAQQALVGTAF